MPKITRRNICFVTGTRAEYGLMARTLDAIEAHPALRLQVIATGMHLDESRGYSVESIRHPKTGLSAIVPWPVSPTPRQSAGATGLAIAGLSSYFARLKTDVVLVVGDRVEAFAAAAAGHLCGLGVAHVHGGDRAQGQVDDSLRHAITKLAHVHLPATKLSADRIIRLGEDRRRVHRVGSPGLDGIAADAASSAVLTEVFGDAARKLDTAALVALHPVSADPAVERRRADVMLGALVRSKFSPLIVVHPNNDPGSTGIVDACAAWTAKLARSRDASRLIVHKNLSRHLWLGLLRDCGVLVGNSSSGIIEAASFGTPVIDIGPRQFGRERGGNVMHCGYSDPAIGAALKKIWNAGTPVRFPKRNIYGDGHTADRIAARLASVTIDESLLRKVIAY